MADSGWADCSYDDLSGRVREGQREDYGEEGVLRHYKIINWNISFKCVIL